MYPFSGEEEKTMANNQTKNNKARVFVSTINKGGTLKTTSTVSIAGSILRDKADNIKNKKILIIDLDTQGNAATAFGKNPDKFEYTIYDVLIGEVKAEEAIVKVYQNDDGRIDILPANDDLSNIEMDVLTNIEHYGRPLDLLKTTCGHLVEHYDFILFDTPPHMGLLVLNTLCFNVGVPVELLIPFQPENFGFRSLIKVLKQFKKAQEKHNPNLKIGGIFGTLVNEKTTIHGEILGMAKQTAMTYGYNFCNTFIPQSIQSSKAFGYESLPVTLVKPKQENKKLIEAYKKIWEEIK